MPEIVVGTLETQGKGRKLAGQGVLHENTMMLRMRMLPNLLRRWQRADGGGLSHGQIFKNQPASGRGSTVVMHELSCDWSFQAPPIPC